MADYREVTACRLCGSTELARVLDLGDTPLANELDGTELFPLAMNRCEACEHHQLSIAVSAERLWGPSYPYQSGTSSIFEAHLQGLAGEVSELYPGGRALDIGCNDGTLLEFLRDEDMSAWGVDPSSAPDTPGIICDSWPVGLHRLPLNTGEGFDAVFALNVFAHVDDLHAFTAAVKEALAPGGTFIIEVGYLLDVIERGHFDTVYSEHLSYHTVRPLVPFFERHGLMIEKVQHVDSQGGSIRVYVRHVNEVPWYDARAEESADASALRKIIDERAPALAEGFAKLTKRGEVICGYGAPAKLTTFLYALGLQELPIACIADDNPLKVGRTTPGMHIPIVSTDDMLARNPDTVVIFAWNFFEDISKSLRARGFRGGLLNPMGTNANS